MREKTEKKNEEEKLKAETEKKKEEKKIQKIQKRKKTEEAKNGEKQKGREVLRR